MFLCKLAVPFIIPLPSGSLSYSLWALRSIVVEWRDQQQLAKECSLVCQPTKVISFIRLGRPASSKSILLNSVISDQAHNTFWSRDCPQGNTEHSVADGLVEASWYLSAGKKGDTFNNITMFLNLRGDACKFSKQVDLLKGISNIIVCCIDMCDLGKEEVLGTMKRLHSSPIKVVLLLGTKDPSLLKPSVVKRDLENYSTQIDKTNMTNTKQLICFKGTWQKNIIALKQELRGALCKLLQQEHKSEMSIEKAQSLAKDMDIDVDEDDKVCQYAKELAVEVLSCMDECKSEMLPLQGHEWQKWSDLMKKKHSGGWRQGKDNLTHEVSVIQEDMLSCRERQLNICENNLSTLMSTFIRYMLKVIDSPAALLYLEWLKLYLDEKSRKTLPVLQASYHDKWNLFKEGKDKGEKTEELKKDMDASERKLTGASLGLEHLFREVAQIYEAVKESKVCLREETKKTVEQFPKLAAQLLLKGEPLEIMDGDVANVPITWVKAVLANVIELAKDQSLLVISIIGIQSSGKSTLLNTMFGLNFAVSAGRCTRGAYMQLLPVDESSDLPYNFVMVIDTEGLRAPQRDQGSNIHDNQLATFAIGLGDVTIMNFKGESVDAMADILQIAVYAFVRMKIVNKTFQSHRTCIFLHQNVPAVNAKEKMRHGCQRIQVTLDEMTVEACNLEHITNIRTFNQVIHFDSQKNVWYFSDLWHGDPPMAPVNPGYSEQVQEVSEYLIKDFVQRQQTFLKLSDMIFRIEDLWIAVLTEDFIFSFKNSLEAKSYDTLERNYLKLIWHLEKHIMDWVIEKAFVDLQRCENSKSIQQTQRDLFEVLELNASKKKAEVQKKLKAVFEETNLHEILIQWEARKMESLRIDTVVFIERAKAEILQKEGSLRIDLLPNEREKGHVAKIIQTAKNLAEGMKGKEVDDNELTEPFNLVWRRWQNEMPKTDAKKREPVSRQVKSLLRRILRKYLYLLDLELEKPLLPTSVNSISLEDSMMLSDIVKDHINVHNLIEKVNWSAYRKPALAEINIIFHEIDVYLNDISKQNTHFQDSYATHIITCVEGGIHKFNQKTAQGSRFTLNVNLMIKVVVHSCWYAMKIFEEMESDYESKHDIKAKLDAYKNTVWNLFKNIVHQRANEVIAADLLYNQIEGMITKAVKETLIGDVLGYNMNHFCHQKHCLMVKILVDLATKANFKAFDSFLLNTKVEVLKWITLFTNEELFRSSDGSITKYANFAKSKIGLICKCIKKSIRKSTEYVQQQPHPDMKIWTDQFRLALTALPLQESDLNELRKTNVTDFDHFHTLLMKRLPELEDKIHSEFKTETAKTIRWDGITTPYKQTLDKLWGCGAQCPFCYAPCDITDQDHVSKNVSHQCIQHRPRGITGDTRYGYLVLENCNQSINTENMTFSCAYCNFECRKSGLCKTKNEQSASHRFKVYKKFVPDWDIAASTNMEVSTYWKWFMARFDIQIKAKRAQWYTNYLCFWSWGSWKIPSSWYKITKAEACNSLCES